MVRPRLEADARGGRSEKDVEEDGEMGGENEAGRKSKPEFLVYV